MGWSFMAADREHGHVALPVDVPTFFTDALSADFCRQSSSSPSSSSH
jgi:hypothetical protein